MIKNEAAADEWMAILVASGLYAIADWTSDGVVFRWSPVDAG